VSDILVFFSYSFFGIRSFTFFHLIKYSKIKLLKISLSHCSFFLPEILVTINAFEISKLWLIIIGQAGKGNQRSIRSKNFSWLSSVCHQLVESTFQFLTKSTLEDIRSKSK